MDKFLTKKPKTNQSDNNEASTSSDKASAQKSTELKHKVARNFNQDWENQYFVMEQNGKPICLLCRAENDNRKFNIERHFNSKHGDIDVKFPLSSDKRAMEIKRLKKNIQSEQNVVKRFLTKNELTTCASYEIAFNLAKHSKPYVDGEFFKKLMCSTVETLCDNMGTKVKDQILDSMKLLQLSDKTISRRVNVIGADIENRLKSDLEKCQCFSLALD